MAGNAAVTLGALATLDPAALAPHANLFLGEWYASIAQSFIFRNCFYLFFYFHLFSIFFFHLRKSRPANTGMRENAAVTLGAVATLYPATLAPHANLFLGEWYAFIARSLLVPSISSV